MQIANCRVQNADCALLLCTILLVVVGCGETVVPPEEAFDPEQVAGAVDPDLPETLRAKQEAVSRLLVAIQAFEPIDFFGPDHPELMFRESSESFYDGTLTLAQWDFDGPPEGDDVPVVLIFDKDQSGSNRQEVRRVYRVTKLAGRFVIERKP